MSKHLEGMTDYEKGFVDGAKEKEHLQADLKAEIIRKAKIEVLKSLGIIDSSHFDDKRAPNVTVSKKCPQCLLEELGGDDDR